jgi:hypothetical protein
MGMMRPLRDEEKALLAALIQGKPRAEQLLNSLKKAVVEEMDDGGMGSLRFCWSDNEEPRRLGDLLAEMEFADNDGVPVMVAINLDDRGNLFELDIWKVDFSPLKRFPCQKKE